MYTDLKKINIFYVFFSSLFLTHWIQNALSNESRKKIFQLWSPPPLTILAPPLNPQSPPDNRHFQRQFCSHTRLWQRAVVVINNTNSLRYAYYFIIYSIRAHFIWKVLSRPRSVCAAYTTTLQCAQFPFVTLRAVVVHYNIPFN